MYLDAIRAAFGWRIDYAQLEKDFEADGPSRISKTGMIGDPDPEMVSTSLVERANLTMRCGMRRFSRKTLGFSRKAENHAHAVDLHFMAYKFCRPHGTLTQRAGRRTTPAMAAGIERWPWTMLDLAEEMATSREMVA